jgi:hypothetical protein
MSTIVFVLKRIDNNLTFKKIIIFSYISYPLNFSPGVKNELIHADSDNHEECKILFCDLDHGVGPHLSAIQQQVIR